MMTRMPHHPDSVDSTGPTLPDPLVDTAVGFLDLLAEPSRLRLLWALRGGELGVTALAETAGCTPTAASQHLAKLRLAGIVSARREGRHTYYTIEDPHVLTMLDQIFGHIAPDGTLAPDPT
jgi:DNA-binding transcriptional ArsR family regulator